MTWWCRRRAWAVRSKAVWSGGADPRSAGTAASTCNNWTSGTSGTAVAGRVLFGKLSKAYAFDTALPCNAGFTHLYCLEQ
jgi:hypothetical protein